MFASFFSKLIQYSVRNIFFQKSQLIQIKHHQSDVFSVLYLVCVYFFSLGQESTDEEAMWIEKSTVPTQAEKEKQGNTAVVKGPQLQVCLRNSI